MWSEVWLVALLLLLVGGLVWLALRRSGPLPSPVVNSNCSDAYDLVIPLGPRDGAFVRHVLPTLFRHVLGLRYVYMVAAAPPAPTGWDPAWASRVRFVPEKAFPFGASDVLERGIRADRVGWYLQQLFKLYAAQVVPHLSPNFVVWDADTLLLTPQAFFTTPRCQGRFATGDQYHHEYFQHMARLHPQFQRQTQQSGICNFMPFHAQWVQALMDQVEQQHPGRRFWQVFLDAVDPQTLSGASEFELYFHYLLAQHPEAVTWFNPPLRFQNDATRLPELSGDSLPAHDVVSVHWYCRSASA